MIIAAWYLVVHLIVVHADFKIPMSTQQDCMVAANMIKDRETAIVFCVSTGYGEKK